MAASQHSRSGHCTAVQLSVGWEEDEGGMCTLLSRPEHTDKTDYPSLAYPVGRRSGLTKEAGLTEWRIYVRDVSV